MIFSYVPGSKLERIDISHFPKGTYAIKVIKDSIAYVQKMVVR
jgi:hypothetical protein